MKAARLACLIIGCAVLMRGPAYAAPDTMTSQQASAASSSNAASHGPGEVGQAAPVTLEKQPAKGNSSDAPPMRRDVSREGRPRGRSNPTKTERFPQVSNNASRSMLGTTGNHEQPGSSALGRTAMGGPIRNQGVRHAFSVQPASGARFNTPTLNNVRHRSPNPAIVGGSGNITRKNDGALDGTRMPRKP